MPVATECRTWQCLESYDMMDVVVKEMQRLRSILGGMLRQTFAAVSCPEA